MQRENVLREASGFLTVIVSAVNADQFPFAGLCPEVFAHALGVVGNDGVGGIENVRGRAVVLLELHKVLNVVVVYKVGHIAHARTAEGVNRLIIVAHAKKRICGARGRHNRLNPAKLQGIGVLKLIDEHKAEAVGVVLAQNGVALQKLRTS